ncbi:MalM family protein [Vibrio pacinii]|uniref:MalM family protein n=1 Tax=Vibrio pacinii TaxID=170674 RepID=UPI000570AF9E|nr:MalM family protein [Vibrio pacinii]
MRSVLVVLLSSSLTLVGCSSSSDIDFSQSYSPVLDEVCCSATQDYPWVFLEQNQALNFEINSSSPVAEFVSGRSYFSAFAFDRQSGNVELLLRSNMENKHVAIPSVELLNEKHQVVRTLTRDDFEIVFSDAFARNRFELKTEVDTVKTPYMVIYTDNSELGNKVVVPHPAKLRAQESGEPMPIATDPTYLASNNGHFSLKVKTLTLSGYNQKSLIETKSESVSKQVDSVPKVNALPGTRTYYHNAIRSAVEFNEIDKALALLEEAKTLNVEGAQQVFIKAVNSR